MSAFQTLILLSFVTLAVLTLAAGLRGTAPKRVVAAGLLLWTFGAIATIWPHTVADLAHALGVGRGADLLLYMTTLSLAVVCFYMYARFRRVERQLTLLVRRLAMDAATETTTPPLMRNSIPSESVRRTDSGTAPRLLT
jgi:small membrane protein